MQGIFNVGFKNFLARLTFILAVVPAVACLAWAVPARAQSQDVQGWWVDGSGKAGIFISPCNGQLCGKIEWLRVPLDKAGKPKTDVHNDNPALRPRLLCGLPILGGFKPGNDGSWRGGWIYDPESGNTYKSVMHVGEDGKLHVRGFIGITLIGRSTVWTKPATPPTPCTGG